MVERLGWTLVHFIWEGASVAALLALSLLATRRLASNLRYGLALAALALLASLPIATFVVLAPRVQAMAAVGAPRWTPGVTILRSSAPTNPMLMLVGVWAVGVVVLSLRLAGTLLHLERWRRRYARPADPEAQGRLDALARLLGLRRRVALFLSDRLEVPSAWGVLRPVIVLPASLLLGLAPAQAEAVLLHELAHVRRHDYLVNLLQSVVETALFYHPAVWWVSSVVRREREHVCDDLVVDALGDPAPYARALLLLEERRRAPRPALSAKEGKLMDRIARILAPRPAPARLSPLAPALAALAVVALALGGVLRAEAQAVAAPKKPSSKKPPTAPSHASTQIEVRLNATKQEVERLNRFLERSKVDQGRAGAPQQRAYRIEVQVLKEQLEAVRAQERALLDAERNIGATYGTPGKGQHPVWKVQKYPRGVGRLTDPNAQDKQAFAEADAAFARSGRIMDPAAPILKAAVAATAPSGAYVWDPKTKTYGTVAPKTEGVPSARQQVDELYRKVQSDAAHKATFKQTQASVAQAQVELARASALIDAQRRAGGYAKVPVLGDLPYIAPLFTLPAQPGTRAQGKTPGNVEGYRRLLQLSQAGIAPLPSATLLPPVGTSFSVEVSDDHEVIVDADHAAFAGVVRALAKKAGLRVVVESGIYLDVTVILSNTTPSQALEILCKAGHATYSVEGGVYYITSKLNPAPAGGGFGGGGGFSGGGGGGIGGSPN